MRAVHIAEPDGKFEVVDRDVAQPGRWQVLVRTAACGVCRSDVMTKAGMATAYPRVPGHEVVGTVESVGEGVSHWQVGQRVGIGWFVNSRQGETVIMHNGRVDGFRADLVLVPDLKLGIIVQYNVDTVSDALPVGPERLANVILDALIPAVRDATRS